MYVSKVRYTSARSCLNVHGFQRIQMLFLVVIPHLLDDIENFVPTLQLKPSM